MVKMAKTRQEKSTLMVGSVGTCSQGWGLLIGSVLIFLDCLLIY